VTFGGIIVTLTGLVVLVSPEMDASLAGLALLFASMVSADVSGIKFHCKLPTNSSIHLADVFCKYSL
jgi:hypothetical protein